MGVSKGYFSIAKALPLGVQTETSSSYQAFPPGCGLASDAFVHPGWDAPIKSVKSQKHKKDALEKPGSPKLRMGAWNLNTLRFGGDCTPLAHPLTR